MPPRKRKTRITSAELKRAHRELQRYRESLSAALKPVAASDKKRIRLKRRKIDLSLKCLKALCGLLNLSFKPTQYGR